MQLDRAIFPAAPLANFLIIAGYVVLHSLLGAHEIPGSGGATGGLESANSMNSLSFSRRFCAQNSESRQ